jgi:hypothetical protein
VKEDRQPLECVAALVLQEATVLAEERKPTKRVVPGAVALLHRSAEFRRLHYFAVPRWEGRMENHEAASLRWVPLTAPHDLDLEVDRLALAEYQRVYRDT